MSSVPLRVEDNNNLTALPDEERIAWIQADCWINYDLAQKALKILDDLLAYPPRDRMPCLLLYGATGMGKTKIIRKFTREHPVVSMRPRGEHKCAWWHCKCHPRRMSGYFTESCFEHLARRFYRRRRLIASVMCVAIFCIAPAQRC